MGPPSYIIYTVNDRRELHKYLYTCPLEHERASDKSFFYAEFYWHTGINPAKESIVEIEKTDIIALKPWAPKE